MNDFFNKRYCDRCGKSLENGRIMSMLNTECICLSCKEKEIKHPDYDRARQEELAEIRKGNMNYKGIQ